MTPPPSAKLLALIGDGRGTYHSSVAGVSGRGRRARSGTSPDPNPCPGAPDGGYARQGGLQPPLIGLRAGLAGVSEGEGLGRWWASAWLGAGWCCARGPEHGLAQLLMLSRRLTTSPRPEPALAAASPGRIGEECMS
jgi:hypothetical protein